MLPARLGDIGARHPGRGPGRLAKTGTSTLARLAPANGSNFAARHWRSTCQSRCIKTLASQSQRLSSCLASSADPVPPAAWPDSAAFRPLHFTAATANDGGALSFRSDGRKLTRPDETGRVPQDARGNLVAPLLARLEPSLRFRFSLIALGRGDKSKMAARRRPAKASAIRREAAPVAEDKAVARDASHGQDVAISARGVACRRKRKQ